MFSIPLRISCSIICALLVLSPANAGVLHRISASKHAPGSNIEIRAEGSIESPINSDRQGTFENARRVALVQRDNVKINAKYFEAQITQLEDALASFRGQLSTFLHTLNNALQGGSTPSNPGGHSTPTGPPKLSPSSGSFDPLSTSNIAVYYGQSPLTTSTNLLDLCSDPSITIINLAFLSTFFGPNGYPTTTFGPVCNAPQTPAQASQAPGLQNCAALGQQILQCQAQGKIVLVSLGGYIASSSFPSAASAKKFATTLWNLFGAGTGEDAELRPFGPGVVVDGFDIDNEDHSTNYYSEFATALKKRYKSAAGVASGKRYYLSSTPQCPRPDASIPLDVMRQSDFVNVQFYNNPACNLNTGSAFLESFEAWAGDLAGSAASTRLFLAAPAWTGAGSGYVAGSSLKRIVKRAKKHAAAYNNFGGIAMWDGVEGLANVDASGTNFVEYAAEALA